MKNITVQSLVESVISEALTDASGKQIVTGRMVRRVNDDGDRGKIAGVTDQLKIRVKWHYSNDFNKKNKETIEAPINIVILR